MAGAKKKKKKIQRETEAREGRCFSTCRLRSLSKLERSKQYETTRRHWAVCIDLKQEDHPSRKLHENDHRWWIANRALLQFNWITDEENGETI